MDSTEQTQALADDLDRLIDRYRSEFDLTYAATVGVLQMKIWLLCGEAGSLEEEEEEK